MKELERREEYDCYHYDDLLETFELKTIKSDMFGSYQGDYISFFQEGNKFGYLEFSYGSCSGCDRLQGCDSYEEVVELRDDLFNNIQWKSATEMLEFIENRDWEGCLSIYHEEDKEEFKQWVKDIKEILIPHVIIA